MLNKLRDKIHKNAVEHGWWESERSFGEIIALCHSELSEALEEHRNGYKPDYIYYTTKNGAPGKPEGIPIELADVIIRILDYCGKKHFDIEEAMKDPWMVDVHKIDVDRKNFGDFITLCHMYLSKTFDSSFSAVRYWFAGLITEIYNYCNAQGIDIDEAIRIKHEYNKSRPYRHGGKVI